MNEEAVIVFPIRFETTIDDAPKEPKNKEITMDDLFEILGGMDEKDKHKKVEEKKDEEKIEKKVEEKKDDDAPKEPKNKEITMDKLREILREMDERDGKKIDDKTGKIELEKLNEFIKTTDRDGLQTLSKFAKNPSSLVENELLGVLGKAGIQGAVAASVIALIISSPEIIRSIVQALAVKGGPLNQDFHRFFEEEMQRGIDRDQQYRRAVGLDVIITTENRGYILQDPGFVHNSLVDIDSTRTSRLSNKDTQYGYVNNL